jgi:protein-tyrosine phosphatase
LWGEAEPVRAREETFRVAFVCTANRFRSPLAAAVFSDAAASLVPDLRVESYGLLELEGEAALPEAIELGGGLGVDLAGHRSRVFRPGDLRDVDLVVGFERTHLAAAVVHGRARRDRTYTLPHAVDLVERCAVPNVVDPVACARRVLEELAREHSSDRARDLFEELGDPIGQPLKVQRLLAERVTVLTRRLAYGLFGGTPDYGAVTPMT